MNIKLLNIKYQQEFVSSSELVNCENNKDFGAFALYIHTHGESENIIASNLKPIQMNDIIKLFKDENCHQSLINKPKIIIFDCCRPEFDTQSYDLTRMPEVISYNNVIVCFSTLLG